MHETDDNTPPDVALGHEPRDISTRIVMIFAASLVAGAVLVFVAIWLIFLLFGVQASRVYAEREYPLAPVGAPAEPPAPRLQTRPREDLEALRAAEERQLTTYGWVNASAGIVRIPIERAMRLTLEQGLPAREGATDSWREVRPARSNSGRTPGVSEK